VGISVGFWEPARLADVTMKPWCFPNLGGVRIAPGFDIGQGYMAGPSMVGGRSQSTAKWHVHWYVYPLLYWMELLTDFVCFEQASFDIAYMTEVDPLWQDDALSGLINPEAIVFANPIAQAACAADCVTATAAMPIDTLFWCAGCQGAMYPMNGNIPSSIGHVQSSRLALSRFAYKMHRQALAWGTMGSKGLCSKYVMPIMRKQQYRFQMVNPIPTVSGRYACSSIGASSMPPGAGRAYPAGGEDMGYLVWRKRNCCVF
jgi:conjugal transfer pilus assembly protein TraU